MDSKENDIKNFNAQYYEEMEQARLHNSNLMETIQDYDNKYNKLNEE